jgi:hypothetical protein
VMPYETLRCVKKRGGQKGPERSGQFPSETSKSFNGRGEYIEKEIRMRRVIFIAMAVLATLVLTLPTAWAGEPHFVGQGCTLVSVSGTCVTVSAKEAGLGDEAQINVELTAEAQCINPGEKHPKAANKADVAADADVPVQNGQSTYTLTGCAVFQPDCSPPMTVVFSDITITDNTNGITCTP